jgi:hypothetical protein
VTDDPKKPVSLNKGAADKPVPAGPPPRTVRYAVGAMIVCGVSALVAAVDLYVPSVKAWLTRERNKSIRDDLKNAIKAAGSDQTKIKTAHSNFADDVKSVGHDVAATQKGLLISVIVALVVLGFIGYSTYRGRHWSRWGVLGLWFLASFTGTLIGIQSALAVAADIPALYKVPAFLSSIMLIGAVLMTNLRPSVEYFASNRPVVPQGRARAGRPRRGLFAPPPPRDPARGAAARQSAKKPAATRAATAGTDRSRSKQRANTAAVAKGAELARTRAKAASKSRRTES